MPVSCIQPTVGLKRTKDCPGFPLSLFLSHSPSLSSKLWYESLSTFGPTFEMEFTTWILLVLKPSDLHCNDITSFLGFPNEQLKNLRICSLHSSMSLWVHAHAHTHTHHSLVCVFFFKITVTIYLKWSTWRKHFNWEEKFIITHGYSP